MLTLLRHNALTAFIGTVLFALLYQVLFHVIASFFAPEALWSMWAHIAFVWVPVILSGTFFFWASWRLSKPPAWRALQVLAAATLAPIVAVVVFGFVWFGGLGKIA